MINCRQATELVIKKEHEKLPLKDRVNLLTHLAVCRFCRMFASQSSLIDRVFHKGKNIDNSHLTATEKEELIVSVRNKLTA